VGKLRDKALRPLNRARDKSQKAFDEALQDIDLRPIDSRFMPPKRDKDVRRVITENGYFGVLPQRDQTQIDFSDLVPFDYDALLLGDTVIMNQQVPAGQAWFIDSMYFYATALGGITNSIILDAGALFPYLIFQVYTSSGQLNVNGLPTLAGVDPQIQQPRGTFPLLNDRVGSRQAVFGITMLEGETIRATARLRTPPVPVVPAVNRLGFRFAGIECPKPVLDEYLRRRRVYA